MVFFNFHFDGEGHNLSNESDENAVRSGNETMSQVVRSEPNTGTFNDLQFYLQLLHQPGCVRVDMAQVIIRRNSFILGIQVVYRCKFMDGTTIEREGPYHDFETGPYASQDAGEAKVQSLALRPGELLQHVKTRQGGILDALVFVTNQRTKYIGGFGGIARSDHETLSKASGGHIVAFAGTYRGVMHRIGYYKKSGNRTILMLIRRLCEQHRAALVQKESPFDWIMQILFTKVNSRLESDRAIQRLVGYQISGGDIPDDIFREILEYL